MPGVKKSGIKGEGDDPGGVLLEGSRRGKPVKSRVANFPKSISEMFRFSFRRLREERDGRG